MSRRIKRLLVGALAGALAGMIGVFAVPFSSAFLPRCNPGTFDSDCNNYGLYSSPTQNAELAATLIGQLCAGLIAMIPAWLLVKVTGVSKDDTATKGGVITGCSCIIPPIVVAIVFIVESLLVKFGGSLDFLDSSMGPILIVLLIAGAGAFFGWHAGDLEGQMEYPYE